jgi:hypothetical protein
VNLAAQRRTTTAATKFKDLPAGRYSLSASKTYGLAIHHPRHGRIQDLGPHAGRVFRVRHVARVRRARYRGQPFRLCNRRGGDPEYLEELSEAAVKFTLQEGEAKALDLKLSALP